MSDRYLGISAYVEFHKAWVVTGLATIKKGRVCTLALANWRNPQTDDPQQPLLVFATDGSGAKGQAGYGATAIRTTGADLQTHTTTAYTRDRVVTEEAGRVVTDPRRPEYIGAVRPTNNTGELSGVYHALKRADELIQPGEALLILSDSQIAICTTVGAWAPRKNKAIVQRNVRALAKLRARGITVRFQHVRAHTGHNMNERADELAAMGAQGLRMRDGRSYTPAETTASSSPPPHPLPPLPHRLPADVVPD